MKNIARSALNFLFYKIVQFFARILSPAAPLMDRVRKANAAAVGADKADTAAGGIYHAVLSLI